MDGRFLIVELDAAGRATGMVVADENQVSAYIDLADCHDGDSRLQYLTERGDLVPVTLGSRERVQGGEEHPFVFAYSPLVAEGVLVGQVAHTDH